MGVQIIVCGVVRGGSQRAKGMVGKNARNAVVLADGKLIDHEKKALHFALRVYAGLRPLLLDIDIV